MQCYNRKIIIVRFAIDFNMEITVDNRNRQIQICDIHQTIIRITLRER